MVSDDTITIGGVDPTADAGTGPKGSGDLTDQLVDTDIWSDELVAGAGIPVVEAPLVTVGGGIGSFVLVDYLRIAGLDTSHVRSLGIQERPWQTYQYLTEVSQIPAAERLRSDSSGCPGNLWGFPSYALREAWREKTFAPLWNVLTEPILTDYWTPRAGTAFADMEREAGRIGYWDTVVKGQVRMVRRRHGGGYFTILTPPRGAAQTKRVAYRSRHVHLAVGYPGLRFLPDLQGYRQKHRDYRRVVNAYEPHEQVYEQLRRNPGIVVVRGGGIVASRVLQRLIDDRDRHGAQTTIIHLFRTYIDSSHGPSLFMRRKGADGWAFQGFNWPKGTWGGQLRDQLEKLEGDARKQLLGVMGGTNTPHRKLWINQLDRGRREGFYRVYIGEVQDVAPGPDNTVVTRIKQRDGSQVEVPADFIVDATGLEADIKEHRVLADVLDHSGAGRNVMGRLEVERNFEVRGTRSEPGRMFASGSATLGGPYAGVDSFLGLQYAALQITDELARLGFCRRIGVARSLSQWWRWARNRRV